MNKQEFLDKIRAGLKGLSEEDISKSTDYYSEMIDDRVEDGLSEEEAIEALGSIDDIIEAILVDTSLPKLMKAKAKTNHTLTGLEILLIVLGSPVWASLLLAGLCIIFAAYMVLFAMVIVVYSVGFSFLACAVCGVAAAFIQIFVGKNILAGIFLLGLGIFSAGLGILIFPLLNKITKGIILIGKNILVGIKHCFIGRRNN